LFGLNTALGSFGTSSRGRASHLALFCKNRSGLPESLETAAISGLFFLDVNTALGSFGIFSRAD
jgi:hypothetical protein